MFFRFTVFTGDSLQVETKGNASEHGIHVASWRWDYVKLPLTTTLFLVIAGWCKIGEFMNVHHVNFVCLVELIIFCSMPV